jgi:hypothetical protein
MANLYCDTPVPAYQEDLCANTEGRILAIAYLRSDHAITNPTDSGQWNTGLGNGTVVIIKNVRGAKPKGAPVQIDGFGRQKTRTVGYERTATYAHPDVIDNVDFYDVLNFDSSHSIAYFTQSGHIWMPPSENPVANIDADYTIEEGLDTSIVWDVAVTWAAQTMNVPSVAPADVFE